MRQQRARVLGLGGLEGSEVTDGFSLRLRRRAYRHARAAHADARVALAGFERGERRFLVTKGRFSLLHILSAVLEVTGAADVWVSTWTLGVDDVHHIRRIRDEGRIRSLSLMVDRSFAGRQPAYLEAVRQTFEGSAIWQTRTHAKVLAIRNDEWSVLVHGSLNVNVSPRLEQVAVEDDAELVEFWLSVWRELGTLIPAGLDVSLNELQVGWMRILEGAPSGVGTVPTSSAGSGAPTDRSSLASTGPYDAMAWLRANRW